MVIVRDCRILLARSYILKAQKMIDQISSWNGSEWNFACLSLYMLLFWIIRSHWNQTYPSTTTKEDYHSNENTEDKFGPEILHIFLHWAFCVLFYMRIGRTIYYEEWCANLPGKVVIYFVVFRLTVKGHDFCHDCYLKLILYCVFCVDSFSNCIYIY